MTSDLLSFRLVKPAWMDHQDHTTEALCDVVPALIRYVRSADADGRWRFQRHQDRPGRDVEVCVTAAPAVLDELEYRLHQQANKHGWPVHMTPRRRSTTSEAGPAERLSAVSSDFALDLLGGAEVDRADHTGLAIRHLRLLLQFVPPNERPVFLFQAWYYWSRPIAPNRRLELVRRADEIAAGTLPQIAEDPAWSRYADALREILGNHPADGQPALQYLLFDHAHLTHNRLGITADAELIAVWAVRTTLTAASGR